jgi:hypothetical protein
VLEDVEMLDAGISSLAVHHCVAEKDRPVLIRRCRLGNPAGKECKAAVLFTAETPPKGAAVPSGTQHIQMQSCVLDGPFSLAAFQFEGSASNVDIRHCRAGRAPNGVLFRKLVPPADAVWQVQLIGNTFQTQPGAGIVCEDPAAVAKRPQNKVVVERNFFVGEPARVGADPKGTFLAAEGNFRKSGTPASPLLQTTEINVTLPTEPARFLAYDRSCPLFRAFKDQPVGAPPDS